MNPEPENRTPFAQPKILGWRRLWRPRRQILVLLLILCAWPCWREITYLAAVHEVRAHATWTGYGPFGIIPRTVLRLAYGNKLSVEGFRGLVLYKGHDLKSIDDLLPRLRPTQLEAEECMSLDLDALKGLTSLRDIIFRSCPALQNLDGLKGLTGLRGLILGKCPALQNVDALNGLTGLQSLVLVGCPALKNVDVLTGLTRLKNLTLMDCGALQNVDALKGLTGLRHLALINCHALSNVDVITGLTSLERLELIGCTELSPATLRDIRAALPGAVIFFPAGSRNAPPP